MLQVGEIEIEEAFKSAVGLVLQRIDHLPINPLSFQLVAYTVIDQQVHYAPE